MTEPDTSELLEQEQRVSYPGGGSKHFVKVLIGVCVGFVILVLALSPGIYLGSRNTPEALLKKGQEHLEKREYDKAIAVYQQLLQLEEPRKTMFVEAERAIPKIRELKRLAGEADTQGPQETDTPAGGGKAEEKKTEELPGPEEPPEVDDLGM